MDICMQLRHQQIDEPMASGSEPYLQCLRLSLQCLRGICQSVGFLGCLGCHAGCCLTVLSSANLGRCHHLHGLAVNAIAVNHQSTRLNILQASGFSAMVIAGHTSWMFGCYDACTVLA